MTLFPIVVPEHRARVAAQAAAGSTVGPVSDTDAFNVCVISGCPYGYHGVLVYGDKGFEAVAAKGPDKGTVEGALKALLCVLAAGLAACEGKLDQVPKDFRQDFEGGHVNRELSLLVGGFRQ